MKKSRLMLPLFAVTLGACSTYTPMPDTDQSTAPGKKASASAALTVEPTTRITNGVAEDQAAYLTGKSLLGKHQTDAAIESFAKALSLNPKMVDAYIGIGIAQSMANRQPLAIAAFDEAVRLEPGNAQWRANLGMAFARNGEFQRASTELSKAWAMAPSNKRIEAQYQRVAETARLERIVAEQAAARQARIDASGMTVITGDDLGNGMRRVSKRVYELDLAPKIAAPAATALPPLVSAEPAEAVAAPMAKPGAAAIVAEPPMVAANAPAAAAIVEDEPAEKVAAPMMPPAIQMTVTPATGSVVQTAPVSVKPIAVSAEQVQVTETPSRDQSVDDAIETDMQASMVGADSTIPASLSAEQIAKAEAEITRREAAPADALDEQADTASAFDSREAALELARQRLFERKLARARIRAARTAQIGLEDQAQSSSQVSESVQR